MLDADYLNILLGKYDDDTAIIYITDETTRIIASTQKNRIGTLGTTASYILHIQHAAVIDNPADDADSDIPEVITYGAPLFFDNKIEGSVIVHASSHTATIIGQAIQKAIESSLEFSYYEKNRSLGAKSEYARIGRLLLSPVPDKETILSLMNRNELDPTLRRSAICIRINYETPKYFNINLNLGYQSSFEDLRDEIEQRIRLSSVLNSQDIVLFLNRNTLVVLKSFLSGPNETKIYSALDIICQNLVKILQRFSSISYHIAYGNIYEGIDKMYSSLQEAEQIIDIGVQCNISQTIYSLEQLLFEDICLRLHPQIVNKQILPLIEKLGGKDNLDHTLIDTMEVYVDLGMRLAETSQKTGLHRNTISKRLMKFIEKTGLDPSTGLNNAFLVKMLAVYLRIHSIHG